MYKSIHTHLFLPLSTEAAAAHPAQGCDGGQYLYSGLRAHTAAAVAVAAAVGRSQSRYVVRETRKHRGERTSLSHTSPHTHPRCGNQEIVRNIAPIFPPYSPFPSFISLSFNPSSHSQPRLGDSLLKQKKSCGGFLYLDPFDHKSLSAPFCSAQLSAKSITAFGYCALSEFFFLLFFLRYCTYLEINPALLLNEGTLIQF